MAAASVFLGLFSLVGGVLFFLGMTSSTALWISLALGLGALVLGFMDRGSAWGKAGIVLGILSTMPALLLTLWLQMTVAT